jgi:hypothetical protein
MKGKGYGGKGARQGRDSLQPRCPALKPVRADWLSPVAGYCAANHHLGRLMIPSIDEYATYCTTDRFCACPWFVDFEGPSPRGPRPRDSAPPA